MKRLWNRRSAGMTLLDLLVVVVLIPLVGAVFMGCYTRNRGTANRVKCSANLKTLGQGLLLYANDNKGVYPMATYQAGPVVIPTWGTAKPEPNDVSAAIFLLMNAEELPSEVFVCPESSAERWDFGGGANTSHNWNNWPGQEGVIRYLSYSMQNPYADDATVKRGFKWTTGLGADYVVMADINPGKSNQTDVLAVTPQSSSNTMRRGNSPNHSYAGQNALFGDGHVDWSKDPFMGRGGDNVYVRRAGASGFASSEIKNSPYDGDDNVLLPTSE